MQLLGDFHTHTIYSHGKNTLEENVKVAVSKGLKQIAVTDHGFNHFLFSISQKNVDKLKKEIAQLKKQYNIEILLGIEANLIGLDGTIDLTEEQAKQFDFVVVGFHKTAIPKSFNDFIKFTLPNWFSNSDKQKQLNTQAYINMLNKYSFINCIAHLNYCASVDAYEIAKVAKEKNVYIELNGKRTKFSAYEINKMIQNKTKFLVNSDAHSAKNIGEINLPLKFAIMNRIPTQLLCNINSLPEIKKGHKE